LQKIKAGLQQQMEMLEESENRFKKIIETRGEGVTSSLNIFFRMLYFFLDF
jgi:hypothetical protein